MIVPYSSLKIYYFSGTGNALRVSKWILEEAEKMNLPAGLHEMKAGEKFSADTIEKNALIGFCSPTHGFNYPPLVLKYILRFPKGTNKVFLINTRAGMKLGRFFVPGLSGIALYFAAIILKMKGYHVFALKPVDMPSNWISLHPGLKNKVVLSIIARCRKNVGLFSKKLLEGGRSYRAFFDIIQDLLISPIAFGYYIIGRFVLAKSFIADASCTMCGKCIRSCPVSAIIKKNDRPFWTFKCESCMKCMNECPERAIQTAHGLVISSLYLLFTIGMSLLYMVIHKYIFPEGLPNFLSNDFIRFVLASALCIPFIWVSYRLVHYLMRFRLPSFLVSYTSLTIFKFWRRYIFKEAEKKPQSEALK